LISGHVWNAARRIRRQRLLVVDEAAMLLAHPSGGAFLADVARRARKYYLGLITIWQKVADLTSSEHGETILTNSDMKLLLKQSDEIIEAADERFRFTPGERRFLLGALKGEGLLMARGGRWPLRIEASLRRHLLAIAKTRRGKSSLILQFAHHLMQAGTTREAGSRKRWIILVDPHSDLARSALALVPTGRRTDVVYLDIANRKRPFGINLLDVGLGWDRDQAVGNALRVFKREFDAFWGPRMEDAFRFALMALFEANEAICHVDPIAGRSSQHTVLEVPDLLAIPRFRQSVLKRTNDPAIKHWFCSYFDPLEVRHRQEIINPVQTKVHKYAGSKVARAIVGQPRSTVDVRELIARDSIVLINLNAFDVLEDTAALIGGTLLNLAARAISGQSSFPPETRRSVTIAVDEFHTIPGADYEQVFGEVSKYGANMILATQTLARLDRLTEADRTRDLRAAVFSNLDGLFAFHTSAEDAEYLAEELGAGSTSRTFKSSGTTSVMRG